MTARIRHITIDCHDSYRLSKFWEKVTGWTGDLDDPNHPEDEANAIHSPDGSLGLLFINVPEPKSVKNRVHLDLAPDTTRDAEVDRLLDVGATLVADHREPDGVRGFVVLADPEGNEFCVERGDAERAR
ncbi:MAG TPA: VOC family protein [Stackebrandtia sp.]|jgi:predicted enzyme related to lactoylglutathione lyase|uniref:VOC family protein n=1 Tax=Stackebrandtia sp. TaxID=2023065 RepID=UPI002D652A87|nr:VOC family protein [Stackebrandtia sp.]HZE41904.1 VOC family protein [Stackebrandtia sp.]